MNDRGVVLMIVLWVMVILSLIVWGLGRRSSLEVSLVETYRGKVKSYAAARAGLNEVLDMMRRTPSSKDTLYAAGLAPDPVKAPADIFSHMEVGPGTYATVGWRPQNFNPATAGVMQYGLSDEESRININALSLSNYQIFSALLQLKGLSQSQADQLSLSVLNYAGNNSQGGSNHSFTEEEALLPKNRPYENVLELLQVNGMTPEIFRKIRDEVTVYGDVQRGLWINVDTADNDVIQAVANATNRLNPSVNPSDITSQAFMIRDGADGVSFTPDDGVASIASVNDPSWPASLQEGVSNYYRARVMGVDTADGGRTVLEAVIHCSPGSEPEIVSWRRT